MTQRKRPLPNSTARDEYVLKALKYFSSWTSPHRHNSLTNPRRLWAADFNLTQHIEDVHDQLRHYPGFSEQSIDRNYKLLQPHFKDAWIHHQLRHNTLDVMRYSWFKNQNLKRRGVGLRLDTTLVSADLLEGGAMSVCDTRISTRNTSSDHQGIITSVRSDSPWSRDILASEEMSSPLCATDELEMPSSDISLVEATKLADLIFRGEPELDDEHSTSHLLPGGEAPE